MCEVEKCGTHSVKTISKLPRAFIGVRPTYVMGQRKLNYMEHGSALSSNARFEAFRVERSWATFGGSFGSMCGLLRAGEGT
jgi:hypothetical protein